jgi:PPM family protein phosphatase
VTALALRSAARTDAGRVRDHNEDAVFATPRLVAVADGVGGHAAGEVASQAAIAVLASLEKRWLSAPLPYELAAAVRDGNERIGFIASCRPDTAGMATTLTAVALGERYVVANIGDSRTYLLRDGELEQLTRDDSYLQQLLESGHVDAAAARSHPHRNLVLEVLDGGPERAPSISTHPAQPGDRLLLCSDGVSDVLEPPAIRELLAEESSEARAAERLLQAALDAGSRDNVSAVVADAVAVDHAPPWRR